MVAETRETLLDLVSALGIQTEDLGEKLSGLEGEITQLTLNLETEQHELAQLEQERDRTLSYYQKLTGYFDEALIIARHDGQPAYCIGKTVVPLEGESNTLIVFFLEL